MLPQHVKCRLLFAHPLLQKKNPPVLLSGWYDQVLSLKQIWDFFMRIAGNPDKIVMKLRKMSVPDLPIVFNVNPCKV